MIKNLVFDCGKVLVDYNARDIVGSYVDNYEDLKTVAEVMLDRKYWDRLDAGLISDEELKADAVTRLPERLRKPACDAYDHWYYNLPPIPGMYELVSELKQSGEYRLYLLSNISETFALNYEVNPDLKKIMPLFDGKVFSGLIHKVKPNRDIFAHLLNTYDLKAGECLFIDDLPANIEGARAAGLEGYIFDGDASKLREYIKNLKNA